MVGDAFRQGGQLQQLILVAVVGVDGGDVEDALGQGARLVEHHDLRFGQHLQVVASLHQNTGPGGAADAAEEGEGHRDHQGAGTGHHQEVEGPLDGVQPAHLSEQGREEGQGHGGQHHDGGIPPGKAGNEMLRLGLSAAGVLHQVQNSGDGGLLKGPGDLDLQQAGQVDAAGDHVVAGLDLPGEGLAGESGGIQGGAALQHHAVQGDALSGLDNDGVSHCHLLRVHLLQTILRLDVGVVGADVHEGGDGSPGPIHRVALEQLAHLIEQHDEDGLRVLSDGQGADGGQGHQEVFIKDLPVGDVAYRPPQHIPADHGVGHQKNGQPPPPGQGEQDRGYKQHAAG